MLVALLAMTPTLIERTLRKAFTVHNSGIVIITGTSSGIGRATCAHLAEKHSSVNFYCGVLADTEGTGYPFTLDNVEPVILDVTKDEDVKNVISKVKESGLPLIGVFNNAGVTKVAPVEFQHLDTYRWHFDVMPFGTFRLTQAAIPLLRESKGRIVITSSIAGRIPSSPLNAAYHGSKKALEALGDSLRMELSPLGVSVSLIEPGVLETDMTTKVLKEIEEAIKRLQTDTSVNPEVANVYPHLRNAAKFEKSLALLRNVGKMEETCKAVDDAMFGIYPKTRYVTAVVGQLPAWIFVKMCDMMHDRMADLLSS